MFSYLQVLLQGETEVFIQEEHFIILSGEEEKIITLLPSKSGIL
jgi:hypothetical protein